MTLHLYIEGFVQGVGFRQYIKYKANRLNITGWVKNLPDQRVEVILSGNQENLTKMVNICRRGPFLANVKKVNIEELNGEHFYNSFDIIKK